MVRPLRGIYFLAMTSVSNQRRLILFLPPHDFGIMKPEEAALSFLALFGIFLHQRTHVGHQLLPFLFAERLEACGNADILGDLQPASLRLAFHLRVRWLPVAPALMFGLQSAARAVAPCVVVSRSADGCTGCQGPA